MFLILRLLFLVVLVFVLVLLFFIMQEEQTIITFFNNGEQVVQVEGQVAQSSVELKQGLMYVKELPESSGMLFIFPDEKIRSFWMKNTLIALDIIFLDKDKNIVSIVKNAEPCDGQVCQSYKSTLPAKYVIEVNTGFCDKFGITEQTKVVF